MTDAQHIEKEASRWVARRDGANWSTADEGALQSWLEQSTAHRVGFLRLEAAWHRADRLAALRRPYIAASNPRRLSRLTMQRVAAALLAIGVLGGGFAYLWPDHNVYRTNIGGRQTVRLADGSKLELNTNTRVKAQIDPQQRTVTLDSGEAYFEVVHDAKRPFTVLAGRKRIIDIGTKFSVRRDDDEVRVLVTEGRVRVEDTDSIRAVPVSASRGTVVVASANDVLVTRKPPEAIVNELGWRRGMLIFSRESLGEAAAEFNRYNEKKVVIEGAAAGLKIGGSFESTNVDGFVRLLREGFGLKTEDHGHEVVISQ
jgi:transmembrane sensor